MLLKRLHQNPGRNFRQILQAQSHCLEKRLLDRHLLNQRPNDDHCVVIISLDQPDGLQLRRYLKLCLGDFLQEDTPLIVLVLRRHFL
jgi:hypothetical protein